jgi:hypothetical protein
VQKDIALVYGEHRAGIFISNKTEGCSSYKWYLFSLNPAIIASFFALLAWDNYFAIVQECHTLRFESGNKMPFLKLGPFNLP